MSQNINERVPSPLPGSGVYGAMDASQANTAGKSGVIFQSQVRDHTGASGGSASGVYNSPAIFNPTAKGVRFYTNLTTGATTGTVTVKLQSQDPASSNWFDITGATSTALTGPTGSSVMTVYPGLSGIANANDVVNEFVGPVWRAVATLANAPSTFTVGADYLL